MNRHYKRLLAAGLLSVAMIITGCGNQEKVNAEETATQDAAVTESVEEEPSEEVVEAEQELTDGDALEGNEPVEEEVDLQEVKPNEVGQIMVVMYHSLGTLNDPYVRSVEAFREDMEILYAKGYRLISMSDYITHNIDVEPGYTPVVFTFDDGHITNFNILDEEQMTIDPECSLGLMEAFYEEHPDFGLKGVFYLNGGYPFKQKEFVEYKLNYLLDHGLEIGNHSYGHENFKKVSASKVEESLGKNQKAILEIVPEAEVTSLALPFGSRPANKADYDVLVRGSYEGVPYEHTSILNVGWKPEYASVHTKFDPVSINRVRAGDGEFELRYWIDYFDENPGKRYISDGDPEIVTIREEDADKVNMDRLGDMTLRTYKLTE